MNALATFPKYDSYKNSGEGWLGEIPVQWKLMRLKHLFYEKKHTYNSSLNCGAISFGEVVFKDDDKIPLATKASYQEVLSGEILVNPLNLNYDLKSLRIALSRINVVVSAGYIVLKENNKINKEYFKYLLHRYDVAFMKLLGSGVRQTINFNHIANSFLVLPTHEEQTAIANFLDQKTAQIDEAVAIKEKQIELLKEHKQVIIQKAVTQGLDPNVPMKDSGVEWIGKIPEHWKVKKLKYLMSLINEKVAASNSALEYLGMESIDSFSGTRNSTISEAEGLSNKYQKNHILFGKLRPYLAKVYLAESDGICSSEFLVYQTNPNYNALYYSKLMLSTKFISAVDATTYGTKMPRASSDNIGNIRVVIPPPDEQKKISSYLNSQKKVFDTVIGLECKQIEKLKEYKTTLINSAVTGKIKVI